MHFKGRAMKTSKSARLDRVNLCDIEAQEQEGNPQKEKNTLRASNFVAPGEALDLFQSSRLSIQNSAHASHRSTSGPRVVAAASLSSEGQ